MKGEKRRSMQYSEGRGDAERGSALLPRAGAHQHPERLHPDPAALPAAQRGPRRANSARGQPARLPLCLPFTANIPTPDGLIHNADKQVIACLCEAVSARSPAL